MSVGLYGQTVAQSFKSDTAFIAEARIAAAKRYTTDVGVNSNFYSGSAYNEYSPQEDEHPYYTADWKYGSVNYGGEQYDNVPLLYDMAEDQLISAYVHGNSIRLVRDKVRWFTFDNKKFIKITGPLLPLGFYQLVYEGKDFRYLIRRQKTFYMRTDGNTLRNSFDLKTDYFMEKDGRIYQVRSQRALLSLLGDKKQEVKRFMRENDIRYIINREASAPSILGYYEQLNP